MNQLNRFGHWLISKTDAELTLTSIAVEAAKVFLFPYCSIHAYSVGKWDHSLGTSASELSSQIEKSLIEADQPLEWTDLLRENEWGVRYVQIKKGTETFAVLAVKDSLATAESLKTIGYLVGIRLAATEIRNSPL